MSLLFPDSAPPAASFGGKGAALVRMMDAGFPVPPWFAVPPETVLADECLAAALVKIGGNEFAVRSSAAAEDGSAHSFAGQFETFLHVAASDVANRIVAVRASAGAATVTSYCHERGIAPPGTPVVLVQRMISPRAAGVAFSADPVNGRRNLAIVSAIAGTGDKLVSGECDGETWEIGPLGEISVRPDSPLLFDIEACGIAVLARGCADTAGRPQDIEWAIDQAGTLWLLQSRAITTLATLPYPDDELRVWDNSNIAESYGGVTTPLTFSFARRIYESVYREFCRLMSVPEHRIRRADNVFPGMLGLIRGRTYYNLANWYRVLALLPGFNLNRSFMEQMMGVKEPLPEELVAAIIAENKTSRTEDLCALAATVVGLLRQLVGLDRQINAFQIRLDAALAPPPVPLERISGGQLAAYYLDLESKLLRKWDAPLVNDFFAMIFYGVLRSLCVKWLGDTGGTLQNEMLADTGGIISAEPPRRILRMAEIARGVSGLPELLTDQDIPLRQKRAAIATSPALSGELERYLADFGDRCLEELKLESPTVHDNPSTLLSSIGALARREPPDSAPPLPTTNRPAVRGFLKSRVFHWILRQAKNRVRCRENLRFERTRLFGRVRTTLREIGRRLHADDRLDAPDDVFFLELAEVLAAWDGTASTADLRALAAARKTEFAEFRAADSPPDRFQTRGPLHRYTRFESAASSSAPLGGEIKGVGACPGRVTGRVRVITDPRNARIEHGEILVAQQTDPGWVILFPAASGLLVERGSLLSHSAIVSRELRLPCVVSIPCVTTRLKTGDLVEMDGSSGEVRVIEST
ncbi:MAG: PEP/pyruvate-binding domain-containing protein [Verrucomicrobiota bacterium]